MCAVLAGPRLADVEIVLAAVAAGAIGLSAFIDEVAMTIALSQFRIAFRRAASAGNPVTAMEENTSIAVAAIRTCVMQTPLLRLGVSGKQ